MIMETHQGLILKSNDQSEHTRKMKLKMDQRKQYHAPQINKVLNGQVNESLMYTCISTLAQTGLASFFPQAESDSSPQPAGFSPAAVITWKLFISYSQMWIPMSQSLSFIQPNLPFYSLLHYICIINKQSCISNILFLVDQSTQQNISVYPHHIKPTSLSVALCNLPFSGIFLLTRVFTPLFTLNTRKATTIRTFRLKMIK